MSGIRDEFSAGRLARLRSRCAGAVATLAMGSWVVLAAIPMVVAILALT